MPKRTPLVCQHLENVSRDALSKYQDIVRDYVRHRQGIYALYRKNKLYYVGLASNLRTRLRHHLNDRHAESWDRFSVYLTIDDSHMRELEALILRIVKTPGNKQKGKFAKSEDLRRRLARDLRLRQRLELEEMLGSKRVSRAKKRVAKARIGKKAILADYVKGPMRLRAHFKGKTVRAAVRKSGMIRFDKLSFTSPSLAGAHAVGRRTCNGWTFWQYQRAPGDWVALDTLRK